MTAQRSLRNHRNNPYMIDEFFVTMHRSAAGVLWRFRAEMAAVAALAVTMWQLAYLMSVTMAGVALGAGLIAAMVMPWTRRFLIGRACCVLSRHRIQRVCFETRMHTRSGRLPLVLRIRPTQVGEKALIWCRAGICAADFEAHAPEIAAACYARQARVEQHKRWAQLVWLHVVRRDTLAPHHVVRPALAVTPPENTSADSRLIDPTGGNGNRHLEAGRPHRAAD
jgi:hypothetical protein